MSAVEGFASCERCEAVLIEVSIFDVVEAVRVVGWGMFEKGTTQARGCALDFCRATKDLYDFSGIEYNHIAPSEGRRMSIR